LPLGHDIDVASFDALHDDPAAWRDLLASIGAEHGAGSLTQAIDGTVLVGLLGSELVIKLYPPFLRDHFEFEQEALRAFHGRLGVPTPSLVTTGERDGWPYLVMTQLAGESLSAVWPRLAEATRCSLLSEIGALAAEVHALPLGALAHLAPSWDSFVATQRAGCRARQERTGLPAHLLAEVDRFLEGELPGGPAVILTGEYTPVNLFVGERGLAGMFDFGDGLVGPREYDWLGPLCFLAAGSGARCRAFFEGYGASLDDAGRLGLMRLLLLHRYSNLRAQLACDGWERAQSFEELAETLWPHDD
jgi:hygromycin-B 7''-O-kinase